MFTTEVNYTACMQTQPQSTQFYLHAHFTLRAVPAFDWLQLHSDNLSVLLWGMQCDPQLLGSVQFTWTLVLTKRLKPNFSGHTFFSSLFYNELYWKSGVLSTCLLQRKDSLSHRYFHFLCKSESKIVHSIHSFIGSFVHSVPFSNLILTDSQLSYQVGVQREKEHRMLYVIVCLQSICWQGSNNLFLIIVKHPARSQRSTHQQNSEFCMCIVCEEMCTCVKGIPVAF